MFASEIANEQRCSAIDTLQREWEIKILGSLVAAIPSFSRQSCWHGVDEQPSAADVDLAFGGGLHIASVFGAKQD